MHVLDFIERTLRSAHHAMPNVLDNVRTNMFDLFLANIVEMSLPSF